MSGTIHCPGCGQRADVGAVVCRRCHDFLPQTMQADLDACGANPALLPLVLPSLLQAVAERGLPAGGRPGMRPLLGGRP